MAKFNPPELALLVNGLNEIPLGALNEYLGQVCTVVEFEGHYTSSSGRTTNRSDYWRVKALNGNTLHVVEPCLQKLPPPNDDEVTETEDEMPCERV